MSLELDHESLLKRMLDAIPSVLFLVDRDLRIVLYNKAAAGVVGEARTQILHKRTGEALHCLNAGESLDGCGKQEACKSCIIRGSMLEAFATGKLISRRSRLVRAEGEKTTDLFMQVKASPFTHQGQDYVLLLLEDMTSFVELQRLIPICAKCHKVRDEQALWTRLDEYVRDHLGADFTHGYCPDCLNEELDALQKRHPKGK